MQQREIADAFDQIADLLELQGENPFRIGAYRKAALNLRDLTRDLKQLADAGELRSIPGVGEDLELKIQEMLATGRLVFLEKLKKKVPESLATLLTIPGIGPKTAKLVYDKFKVKSIDHLEQIVKAGKLHGLPGFQEKKAENILRGIQLIRMGQERMSLGLALPMAEEILRAVRKLPGIKRIEVAGSLRRRKETVRDIDILITSGRPAPVMEGFVKLPFVHRVQGQGPTKSSIRTAQGVQVDLRVVDPEAFGAALVYFTGSKEHNVRIRSLANKLGLTINEYGVFKLKGNKRVAGREEADVYKAIGLRWIPPELREDRGEIEAARSGSLPRLIETGEIKGSFHNHTNRTDGHHSLDVLAQAVKAKGYRYMLLSDHSQSLRIARGLSPNELLRQMEEVKKLNKKMAPFRILMGSEVDILPDGRLDYPDSLLKKLDVVIAAVHSAFKQPKEVMTRRIIKGMQNRYVSILAHPTGRLLGEREPYQVDMEQVCRAAAKTQTALEINCCAQRLDLNDVHARQAREAGAKLVVSTDTHVMDQLDDLQFGVSMARRAWAGPKEVLNTMDVKPMLAWVAKKRGGNGK